MKPEIKQRIEQIKVGQVPNGYKRTKAGIMPCEWCSEKEYKAKDVFKSVTNKKHNGEFEVLSATQDKGVIPRSQVDIDIKFNEDNIVGYKKVDKGDFVISLRSFQGGIEYSEYEGLVSPAYTVLKPKIPICDGYYKAYLKTVDYISRLNKGTYGIRDGKQIGFEDFGDMIIHYPSLVEQEKIAEILSAQDKVIELKEKLLEEKKKQKKYLMQQLLTGKKRLPGFDKEWHKKKVADYATLYTDSIDPCKYPDEPFDVYSLPSYDENKKTECLRGSEMNSNKFVVAQGMILFNKLNVRQKRVWYIETTSNKRMLCSTEFLPLRVDGINPKFITQYLMTDLVTKYFIVRSSGTSNSQQRISPNDLLNHSFFVPRIDEQNRIVEILETYNKMIELLQKQLSHEKQKKKALIQLLLTGIVRVNV